jgi:hypothetical protein
MDIQILITVIIIFAALGYAAWRVYDAFRAGGDPCKDCDLKKNCKKFGKVQDNSYLCTRKSQKCCD